MPAFNRFEHVFKPLRAGRNTLKNRIIFSPMVCDFTDAISQPTQNYVDFVEEQAKTGVAMVTLGATPINFTTAPDFPAELNVTEDVRVQGLVLLAKAAHRHGAKLSVELVHAGRAADPNLLTETDALAASNFPIPGKYPYIKEMDQRDMDQIIADYVDCALRVQRAQFDAVLIHAAHGNLIGAFLSPMTNTRSDIYGGSLENRMRFPLAIIKAMREAVGPHFLLDMRISGDEILEGGMRIDEVIEFIKVAQQYIDMVNISAGLIVDPAAEFFTMPPYYQPHLLNVHLSRQVKACPDIHIPVSVVGRITSIEEAESVLAAGDAVKLWLSDETFEKFAHEDAVSYPSFDPGIIVYEDDNILIINKPAGMLSQKSSGSDISACELLCGYLIKYRGFTQECFREYKPSAVNRLDRNTTGLLLCAKNLKAASALSAMLKDRTVKKEYLLSCSELAISMCGTPERYASN